MGRNRPPPNPAPLRHAPQADGPVAGIDEAGRGPLAGPVVAAAVILPPVLPAGLETLDDSKKLSAGARHVLFARLQAARPGVCFGVGLAEAAEIDRHNILAATLLAMQRAVQALPRRPVLALVDGNRLPDLPCRARAIVGGDQTWLAIAAASIVAKVTRDRMMQALATFYPAFGWARNAGYPTPEHREALALLGPTTQHRSSFTAG